MSFEFYKKFLDKFEEDTIASDIAGTGAGGAGFNRKILKKPLEDEDEDLALLALLALKNNRNSEKKSRESMESRDGTRYKNK